MPTQNTPTVDVINFSAVLAGGITITLTSALPSITDPLFIDGFTANGYVAPNPRVSVLGGGSPNVFNLSAGGKNSTIRGFAISNTSADGIYISGATGVTISGCWIGLLATGALPGTAAAKVGGHGIYIVTAANGCFIGIATLAGKNVISGCVGHGIVVVGSSGVTIKNNYIGTNTTGTAAISNGIHGVNIDTSPSAVIGGSAANEANLISGNFHGVNVVNSSNNPIIKGNKVGTNLAGTAAIANTACGIVIDNSTGATVGGAAANEGNLLSGNTQSGLVLSDASSNATVKGNIIGTDVTGTVAIANVQHGINIYTNVLNTIIGGGLAGEGNLISGNGIYGMNIDGSAGNCSGSVIQGNKIGTNLAGTAGIGNTVHGIFLQTITTITIGGGSKALRNIISGNGANGIGANNSNSVTIQGNFIGTSVTGLAFIRNMDTGISLTNSSGNTIGGASYMQRNITSGNKNFGMYLQNVDNSSFTGNYIGTDSTGNSALGNLQHGVSANSGCDLNTWTSNVAAGNGAEGMDLLTVTNNTFYNNYCGLGINGITAVPNVTIGFRLGTSSTGNIVGGIGVGQRNYMSGNGNHGMMFDGQSTGNIVKGNYVGCDITGLIAVPNQTVGLLLLDGSDNSVIGGAAAGEGNIFCCSVAGTGIQTQITSGATIYGNLIGVDKNGTFTSGFGNFSHGIYIMSYTYLSSADNNSVIGGLAAGQANTIANNGGDGVRLAAYPGPVTTNFNSIIGNKIYCNGGLGIHMEHPNAFENEGILAPVVTSSTAMTISGTGVTGNTIHVYRNQFTDGARCDCEGEIYIGTVPVVAGVWSLTHNLGLNANQVLSVTATQTNPTHSTSEFWVCSVPLPVDLLTLEAKRNGNTSVDVNFSVTSESNINIYHILRSKDGINFEMIGSVIPKNDINGITSYSFEDLNPLDGASYYRIQTVENNGRVAHSKIVYTSDINTPSVTLFPNPATDEVTVVSSGIVTRIELHNTIGQMVYERNSTAAEIKIPLINLATGVYFVKVFEGETAKIYKLEKR